jgi:Uma2 family endonuclease
MEETPAEKAEKPMSAEEFFGWQEQQEDRYELVEGFPVKMMTGASNFHDTILVNIVASLHAQLRGSRCRATTPDTAVRTRIRSIRRPDVTVTCDEPRPDSYEAGKPRLVVEVLSPSNAGRAWQRKLDEYFRREGLAYLLLVDSEAVGATLYTRTGETWDPADYDAREDVIEMPEIGCRLALRDVYEGLEFAQSRGTSA